MVRESLPLLFPQACSIRDPNSGYVFDLNPLNRSQGYVLTGIGKTFVVRRAGAALTGGEDASESLAAGHGGASGSSQPGGDREAQV